MGPMHSRVLPFRQNTSRLHRCDGDEFGSGKHDKPVRVFPLIMRAMREKMRNHHQSSAGGRFDEDERVKGGDDGMRGEEPVASLKMWMNVFFLFVIMATMNMIMT